MGSHPEKGQVSYYKGGRGDRHGYKWVPGSGVRTIKSSCGIGFIFSKAGGEVT